MARRVFTVTLACAALLGVCRGVSGLRLQAPLLNVLNVTSYNYTRLLHEPDLLPFLLTQTPTPNAYSHALASFAPEWNGVPAIGNILVMDPQIYLGLDDPYFCSPPPKRLKLNPEFLRESGARGYYRVRPVPASDDRWRSLNTTVTVAGSILIVSRGTCSFQMKAYFAQQAGATALIITNQWPPEDVAASDDYLITMNADPNLATKLRARELLGDDEDLPAVTMPTLFVTRATFISIYYAFLVNIFNQIEFYYEMQLTIWNTKNPTVKTTSTTTTKSSTKAAVFRTGQLMERATGNLPAAAAPGASPVSQHSLRIAALMQQMEGGSGRPSGRVRRAIPRPSGYSRATIIPLGAGGPDFAYQPMIGTVDQEKVTTTAADDSKSFDSFRVAAYFLLVLPGIWFLLALIYASRRCGIRYRERRKRDQRAALVQAVIFHIPTAMERVKLAAAAKVKKVTVEPAATVAVPRRPTASTEAKDNNDLFEVSLDLNHHQSVSSEMEMSRANSITPAARPSDAHPQSNYAEYAPVAGNSGEVRGDQVDGVYMSSAAALVLQMDHEEEEIVSPAVLEEGMGVGRDSQGRTHRVTGNSCAVCLSDFDEGDKLSLLPCHHAFHPGCIKPWLEKSSECCTCRTSITRAIDEAAEAAVPVGTMAHWRMRCLNWCCPIAAPMRPPRAASPSPSSSAASSERRAPSSRSRSRQQSSPPSARSQAPRPTRSPDFSTSNQAASSTRAMPPAVAEHEPFVAEQQQPQSAVGHENPLFVGSHVRRAVQALDALLVVQLGGGGAQTQDGDLEAARLELSLTSGEYATASESGSLTRVQALALLAQMQAEVAVLAHAFPHAAGAHPDIADATLACESVLQFATHNLQRGHA